ncbi:transposase, IS605 OrfB family, central region [Paenibacillus tianmuensis]|uniref:Transposase, IS605 OrfB family, central region n=1 Tax=Paenibacillus tianmuensis TaxID=624147 RepID=A0A1G4RFC5_9BACL|nr:RNA-guided endonuclease TnpB family protein [Paenibacillus tianmuensis]SCW54889.1 transposase, IS605 OrfB family, central region [Paenibacillus tianmuensis]
MQTITVQIRIFPNDVSLLKEMGDEYIKTVNLLTEQAEASGTFPKLTSKDVDAKLPSAVKNQAIRDARSIHNKTKKQGKRPILKRRAYYVNNQNYSLGDHSVASPVILDGNVQRLKISAHVMEREQRLLSSGKLGLLKIVEKSGKWYVQISIERKTEQATGDVIMGIDLGIKIPAVVVTSTGKTKFVGNGRQNKYIRRKYKERRRKMGKLKKLSAIRKQENKEHRYMKDQNHKISRKIVNMAIEEQVSVIKLEKLTNLRQTTRTSRKNAKNLHNWTFYQLQTFIAYKAALAGISIIEVNPAYTSQTCPSCEKRNKAKGRTYECSCGYRAHRDRVGAINIMRQPVIDGNSLSA